MPKFAANLTMLFTEVPLLERFSACREAGFNSCEVLFPYDYKVDDIKIQIDKNKLEMVLFNLPAGDWSSGDRGISNDPAKIDMFRQGVESALKWAKTLNVSRVNCLVGKRLSDIPLDVQSNTVKENLSFAADALAAEKIDLLIEFINHFDVPRFLLNTSKNVLDIIDEINKPNIYLQYDVYHAQREEGNLAGIMRENLKKIKHVQIADNPGRNQPGTGEINYKFLLHEFDRLGYDGYVSLEYIPKPDTWKSFEWFANLGFSL